MLLWEQGAADSKPAPLDIELESLCKRGCLSTSMTTCLLLIIGMEIVNIIYVF